MAFGARKAPVVVDVVDTERGRDHRSLGDVDYDTFLANGDAADTCPAIADERQPIFLTYTTGDPKGAMSSARQVYLNRLRLTTMWALPRHPATC